MLKTKFVVLAFGLAALPGCRARAYTWDNDYQDEAKAGKVELIELPANRTWEEPWTMLAPPNRAVAMMKPRSDRTVLASQGSYDQVVGWLALGTYSPEVGGVWWERVDCRKARLGTFLLASTDSSPASDAAPDVWWSMRSEEAKALCPGQQLDVPDQRPSTEAPSALNTSPDTSAERSVNSWVNSRRKQIYKSFVSAGYLLGSGTSVRDEGALECEVASSSAIQHQKGEAGKGCLPGSCGSSQTFRLHDCLLFQPRTFLQRYILVRAYRQGYLYNRNQHQDAPDLTQRLPAKIHAEVIRTVGKTVSVRDWYKRSLSGALSSRGVASGWVPWW